MRLVLATTAPSGGGVWQNVCDLAAGFSRRGADVIVATSDGVMHELTDRAGFAWIPLAEAVHARADIWHLHLHDTYSRQGMRLLAARRPRRGALIVTEHLPRSDASDWQIPATRSFGARTSKTAFKRFQASLVDRVIAVSVASRLFMLERYRIDPWKISVVHYGISVPAEPAPPSMRELPHVLVAAALIQQKGIDVLIEAAGRSALPWPVRVVGEGPHLAELERLAGQIAPGRIEFLGWSKQVASELAACDISCLPSRWEALPFVILEAMALGRVVVASAVDGIVEEIDSGRTGLLVPSEDPTSLADALDSLASPSRRNELGAAGRRRLEAWFTADRMIEGTLSVYEGALARRGLRDVMPIGYPPITEPRSRISD